MAGIIHRRHFQIDSLDVSCISFASDRLENENLLPRALRDKQKLKRCQDNIESQKGLREYGIAFPPRRTKKNLPARSKPALFP
jgi:hypothetical protein